MTSIGTLLYTGRTRTVGSRETGLARSSDGRLDVRYALPGSLGIGSNAEQLFGAAWSIGFIIALQRAAVHREVHFPSRLAVDAEVGLWLGGADDYTLGVRLIVSLPDMDRAVARQIIEAAHLICPYSKATHGNIAVVTDLA